MKNVMTSLKIATVAAVVVMTGCAEHPQKLGPEFGYAVTELKEAQILNPDAGVYGTLPSEMDGVAMLNALDTYRGSFEEKDDAATAPVFSFKR